MKQNWPERRRFDDEQRQGGFPSDGSFASGRSTPPWTPQVVALSADGLRERATGRLRSLLSNLPDAARVVLDLRGVSGLEPGPVALISAARRRLEAGGGDLRLCCPEPAMRQTLQRAGLHLVFDVHNTREEALKALSLEARRPRDQDTAYGEP